MPQGSAVRGVGVRASCAPRTSRSWPWSRCVLCSARGSGFPQGLCWCQPAERQLFRDVCAAQVLIFAEKKADVDAIHEYLLLKGVEAVAIHGGKGQ